MKNRLFTSPFMVLASHDAVNGKCVAGEEFYFITLCFLLFAMARHITGGYNFLEDDLVKGAI